MNLTESSVLRDRVWALLTPFLNSSVVILKLAKLESVMVGDKKKMVIIEVSKVPVGLKSGPITISPTTVNIMI